jgi:hypothetical protein
MFIPARRIKMRPWRAIFRNIARAMGQARAAGVFCVIGTPTDAGPFPLGGRGW